MPRLNSSRVNKLAGRRKVPLKQVYEAAVKASKR